MDDFELVFFFGKQDVSLQDVAMCLFFVVLILLPPHSRLREG